MDVRYHYIRQEVNNGTIQVEWIGTNDQLADGFTKALDRVKFERFIEQIHLVDCSEAAASQGNNKRVNY